MKKKLSLLILFLMIFSNFQVYASSPKAEIVPIKGEINNSTVIFVQQSIREAEKRDAPVIIFEIDTYGGAILAAEKIKSSIMETEIPTVAFVNNKAESAGVLITIACEKVYMSKTATIGSAEPIPNTEKNLSFWRGMLRDTAQARDRDSKIIEAMADKDIEIPDVSPKGKLVNLTSKESLEFGISDGVYEDYISILKELDLGTLDYEVSKMDATLKFVNLISNPTVSTILLIVGMVGFVIEIFTPGFGVGGILSIISFGLFFIGNTLGGSSNWYAILIFVLGVVLLIVELIVPGFGIAGIGGIVCVFGGVILAMESLQVALTSVAIALIISIIVTVYFIKKGSKLKFVNKITNLHSTDSEKGYISVESTDLKVGQRGKTLSILRPTGFIEVDGKRYEAIAYDGFLEKDVEVEVNKIEAFKVYVRRVDNVK
ncbi:NfeD family protein [Anaerosphaera multitolerans]|uniref:Nodulation protein NfeD n=1 Tax=Anaerosphaera multitolerans TaxID=2487351 RepID=A0A437S8B4_9FIRM|nr:NfeD family protein [Anaerosphaera multitolerans]RVU55329.1 nodulation protein NfeD [Anaerosphaera multitolerans]